MRKPEIMSPAGHWPQLNAAIEAGADSVYFGLTHFSARAKVGFTLEELPSAIATLHKRGVKGYVTFNTLVFDRELKDAATTIEAIAQAGADAIIVQDLGICSLAHQIAPDLEIHGSTQMSITNSDGVRLAQRLGATRVNLARELSLDEIAKIRRETDCELEIFVHGALCVAYSGQCFSSEAWGGRSANRGQCAQACRLPYQLIVDDHLHPLDDARYLLSPGDLYTLEWIPKLIPLGISSLKIEGRYKDAEYVALTTAAYRKAVDSYYEVTPLDRIHLEQVYSRGLGPFFLSGTNHQTVVEGRGPRHRGVLLGRVKEIRSESVVVALNEAHQLAPLKPGDGIVFDSADWRSPQEKEEGGRIYTLKPLHGNLAELGFANQSIRFDRIRTGDLLWRTSDPDTDKLARKYTEATQPVYRRPIAVRVQAITGQPLELHFGHIHLTSPQPLVPAERQGLTLETLQDQLSRLGNTPYQLGELSATIVGNPFVPVSMLNQLRRQAVEQLTEQAAATNPKPTKPWLQPATQPTNTSPKPFEIHLLIRAARHLDAAIDAKPASITLDYLDLYGLWPSLEKLKASGIPARVASPRVLKPGEDKIADFLTRLDCGLLIRSAGLLDKLKGRPNLTGDFSLNAANTITAQMLLDMGLDRLTPTHDLNAQQIESLARQTDPARIEVVAYQHLPVFHTEHCVFCRFLSEGTSYLDCGRPCEEHEISLEDEQGRRHPVVADVGCRNTVFGAQAQHAAAHLNAWQHAGIHHLRLEFVHETADQVRDITHAFQHHPQNLERLLRRAAPEGLTEGSLFIPKSDPAFKIL
jgi:putative protease